MPQDRESLDEQVPMTAMQSRVTDPSRSLLKKYRELVVGSQGIGHFIRYELAMTLTANCGGGLGFFLRKIFLSGLFQSCGRGVVFGPGIMVRHPHRIRIGSHVVFAENVLLDGKGERDVSIEIGDQVFIGRNSLVSVHNGYISIGNYSNIGAFCALQSSGPIHIGEGVIMAAFCHIVSSSRKTDRTDIPIIAQGTTGEGISIDEGTWLGSGVIVTDGVKIGKHCVIGAGAVVVSDIPDYAVAVGVPAKIVKFRKQDE